MALRKDPPIIRENHPCWTGSMSRDRTPGLVGVLAAKHYCLIKNIKHISPYLEADSF